MRLVLLAAVVVLGATTAGPAAATFPGRDGRIAFFVGAACTGSAGPADPCVTLGFTAIRAVAPSGRASLDVVRCPGPTCLPGVSAPGAYSPGGRMMAVVIGRDPATGASQVAILRSDGSQVGRVTVPVPTAIAELRWLRDGRLAAYPFADDLAGPAEAFLIGADRVAHAVTWHPAGVRAWSSRGDVAIANDRGIYVVDGRHRTRRLLLRTSRRFHYGLPDWSPDAGRLVVTRLDLQTSLDTIITVSVRRGRSRIVVRRVGAIGPFGRVVWSPSGRRLAFLVGGDDNEGAVYTVRLDGADLRRVFDLGSVGRGVPLITFMGPQLSWQPLTA